MMIPNKIPPNLNMAPSSRSVTHYRALSLSDAYDLMLLVEFALLLPALMLLPTSLALLRIPFGLAGVLFVPGYAFQAALFPGRSDADAPIRAGLSMGLSVALIPLGALLLDWLPWGIQPWPITILLIAWIITCSCIAAIRRERIPLPEAVFIPPLPAPHRWWDRLRRTTQLGYIGGGLGIVLLLGILSVRLISPESTAFTEFYILGPTGEAEGYPYTAYIGTELRVTVGIANREREAHNYRVEVWVSDPWDNQQPTLVANTDAISLQANTIHEQPISWQIPFAGDDQVVEFLLFSDTQTEPYRRLRLSLNARPDPNR